MEGPAVVLAVLLLVLSLSVSEASFFPKKSSYEVHHVDLTSQPQGGFSTGPGSQFQQQGSWGKKVVWKKRWERVCRPEWQQVWKKEWVSEWEPEYH